MPRGRPRQFDEDAALGAALDAFWTAGFSATSLDGLADAMDMKRPSIRNAFGGKESLYRLVFARFRAQLETGVAALDASGVPLREGLVAFFDQAIEVYTSGEVPRGCFIICTAPAEAVAHPEIGVALAELIDGLDAAFQARLRRAVDEGELDPDPAPELLGQMLQGMLHTIALRARVGASPAELRELARFSVARLLGEARP